MPLGYRAAMDRWRAASPSTYHPLLPSKTSSSSPQPSLLPSSSRKRSRSPSPSPPIAVPPPPEHIESVRDNIEAKFLDLERHLGP
ncbi:hypothetical protein Tco_0506871 [Tanacetum coccineum]